MCCVKQVPEIEEAKIDEESGTLVREGVPNVLNPFDEFALNVAVDVQEMIDKEVEIIAISMGPPQAEEALRKCLAIGADKAILLTDKAFAGADTWATSLALSKAIEKVGDVDIVFCGQETLDGSTAQVGPEIAGLLSLPLVTYVEDVEEMNPQEKFLISRKEVDEGYVRVKSKLPCLLTCLTPPDFEPRIPKVTDIMKAKKKPLVKWDHNAIGEKPGNLGIQGSRSLVTKVYPPKREKKGIKIDKPPEEAVEKILEFLGG